METKQATNGIGFGTLLFIVFLVLKLINVINWSWWWVTAPIWIPIGIAVLIMIATTLFIVIKETIRKHHEKTTK